MKKEEVIQRLEQAIKNLRESPMYGVSIYNFKIDISEGVINTHIGWDYK